MVIRVGNTYYTVRIEPFIIAFAVLIALIGLKTSIYTVQAEYEGVVTRFGKYLKTASSGLHFKLPYGIDSVELVPVERQLIAEFGSATAGATNPHQYSPDPQEQDRERNMVTGDLNAASVEWVIQYRISDPKAFRFAAKNPEDTLRDTSESVMREVVGDRSIDEVLTFGRQAVEAESQTKLQELVVKYKLGLEITQVQLSNVNPPPPVHPSFNEVNQAQQEREKLINIANGEYNKIIPRARGEAEGKIRTAEGYAIKRINEAEGDAARFIALLTAYQTAPEVTRRRIYLETMKTILPAAGKKIIIDESAKQILPLLQLNTIGGNR